MRSNNVTFGGTISGTGTLTQLGSGNLILSADNSYLGTTTVQAGGLYINGDQSAATGDTNVVAGTLGGGGTIGGDVTLAAGTSLSPGALGTAPGTLTINGFLEVGDNADLNYSFGQANVVGGALNDLTIVHGDLTFDGGSLAPALINVVSASTSFDAGIYRVVTYDGTLTGADGLAVGSQPLGTDFFVQTSVANQINLVNLAGLNLSFWDGPALPRNNGVLEGGTGTWILNNNENWATIDGLINAPYQNGSFTVFQGAAGTVTVDNSQGQLTAAGMQFATDGYTLAGGTLTLAGPQSTIRVGDGTLAGAGYVATITSVLQGGAQLVKADLGTLVLTATNTYSGGTAINGGTLQVASNGNLGALAGGLSFDGGTLENTAAITSNRAVTLDAAGGTFETTADLTLTGLVSGTGALTKDGAGTLVLTATNNYTGNTTIAAGTLQLGAGGTTGSILGDVVNNGTLGFNRSNSYTFAGDISGTGEVNQIGTGTTILTGTNNYSGPTNVVSGALLINGDQSGATGLTSVMSGATLGGGGIIGGNVTIAGGGTLRPGGTGNAADTLTINGNLTLAATTVLAYNFAQANAPGGALNDLVTVGGNLTLNGTITVTATAGGSFGPGVYRVFNYSGLLTDNGLTPGSPEYFIQTSVAGQVNLISTGGQLLTFWDGDAGGKNDGVVDGGSGIWEVVGTRDNWTIPGGEVNAFFSNGNFAIFQGAPGMVTVDNGNGQVMVDGIQFAADGYIVTGDPIALVPGGSGMSTIDVGNHAPDGADFVATIESDLIGASGLVKSDLGTLILKGSSIYTGSTRVAAGTLEAGRIGAFNATSAFTVDAAGTLDLAGFDHTLVSLDNAGAVRLGSTGAGTVLTITGNYRGTGGTVHLNAALGDDTATTDRLVINGNSLGTTTLAVNGIGSSGALTTDGIKVVDVMGTSDGTFTLDGDHTFRGDAAVVGGAYAYRLYAGSIDNPADGDWYLRSTLIDSDDPGPPIPLYQPGVPLYEAYANVLQSFNKLETMRQRVGNRTWSPGDAGVVQVDSPDGFTEGNGMWGRIDADRATYDVWSSTSGTNHADMTWRLQAGIDGIVSESEAGRLIGGISAEFGTISAAIASVYGTGAIASNAAGLGGTLTWYSQGGFYLDGQAKVTWYDSTLTSHTANLGLVSDNMGIGYGLSIEAGHKIALGSNWSLTPQAQLAYSSVGYADFTDVFGAAVSLGNSRSIRGRLGVSADYEQTGTDANGAASSTHLYGIVNVDYDFDGSSTTSVSGTSFANDNDPLWGTAGIGGSYNWGDNKYSIYGEATAATSLGAFGESFGFSATGGLRIRW